MLRQVYDELYDKLGDEFSPAELIRAAQTLIEVTNEEYGTESFQDGQLHPGYYSFEVDRMIVSRQWWLLAVEARPLGGWDEDLTAIRECSDRLKRLYNPDPYYHRG